MCLTHVKRMFNMYGPSHVFNMCEYFFRLHEVGIVLAYIWLLRLMKLVQDHTHRF